ncbi:ketopantoate reductase PanE/ApbA C terminal-domain-containing protein [Elsinoe ampelina]|uniref:Ketopantoate reductase PanE/ApbA C terminal-domain-containing protein n=1 Tax=Elsinoe ampelina TaxID=302913 RepID=A0A6A6G8U7_9PEZI|nr:ketopantoate reductase PanE/ApbA C terminal-domain-containing protein [Elsinoe ampelina]
MSSQPQILIFGAGAVGAFYGALLARSSPRSPPSSSPQPLVSVVCRSNFPAVSRSGFHITSPSHGTFTWRPAHVFPSPAEARKSGIHWDYVVIATKALPDQGDDSGLIEGLVGRGTGVVLVQNGLGVEGGYWRRFVQGRGEGKGVEGVEVLSGVTVVSAEQPENGVIRHNRWTRINVGPYAPDGEGGEGGDGKAEEFCGLLREGGVRDAEAYSARKLQLLRWHKIAINAAMNPSSVLSGGTPNGAMATDEEMGRHLLGVMREVLETAPKVCGEALPGEFASAEKILESTRKNTSGSRPSMWADWEGGKRMELEVIMGAPIRMAREKGLEMRRLESMYALLKMAQKNRDERARGAAKL